MIEIIVNILKQEELDKVKKWLELNNIEHYLQQHLDCHRAKNTIFISQPPINASFDIRIRFEDELTYNHFKLISDESTNMIIEI